MTTPFDASLEKALKIIETADLAGLAFSASSMGQAGQVFEKRVVLVRDLFGRIHLAFGERPKADGLKIQVAELAASWHDQLKKYSPSEGSEFFFSDELLVPEALWQSPDLVLLGQVSKDGVKVYLYDRALGGQDWIRSSLQSDGDRVPRLIFHGIKGGVGRSSALAMSARRLAELGKRVLVVDLDLESPGLTSILLDPERLPEFGLVDYFVESASENLTIADFVSREGVIYQRSFLSDGTQGEIFVVPAYGIAAGDYIAKLSRTYVETPSDRSSNTRGFAERLHDFLLSLEQVLHPDVVLLDSRAGIDDIGAAIIGRLGGHTLLFGTSSSQTWRGYELLFDHLKYRRPRLDAQAAFKVVAALVPETNRALYIDSLRERAYETFSSSLYEEIQGGQLSDNNFSINSEDAPHFPLSVFWRREYMEFDPLKNHDLFDGKQVDAVFGELLEYVVGFAASAGLVTNA